MSDPKTAAVSVARENDSNWVLQWGWCPSVLAVGTPLDVQGGSFPRPSPYWFLTSSRAGKQGDRLKGNLVDTKKFHLFISLLVKYKTVS